MNSPAGVAEGVTVSVDSGVLVAVAVGAAAASLADRTWIIR